MTKLEERIRSGLHETAERIPETEPSLWGSRTRPRRPAGVWMGVAAVFAVLVLFSPMFFFGGSDPAAQPGETSTSQEPAADGDVTPAGVGFEFANPEHVRLRFTQDLTLSCQGLDTVDEGGFDSFDIDIWIDHETGYTRVGIDYPDGSTHDLIFKGRPGDWEQAWGSGTDLGRSAGCRETMDDGVYTQSIAGWAFQDASELWFTAYLKPVSPDDGGVVINHEGNPTQATSIRPRTYLVETVSPGGTQIRHEYTLDEPEIRVIGEQRYIHVPDEFDANATIEVLESGPAPMPMDIFNTSNFTPLWGGEPVPTTESTGPSAEVGSVVGTWGLDSITVHGQPMALSPDWRTFDHPDVAAWIMFNEAGLVNGRLTCNGFMGEYEQVGSVIDWEVVKEAAACIDEEQPGVMEAEEPMTDLIWTPRVDVEIDEEEGTLALAGNDVVMTFSRLAD